MYRQIRPHAVFADTLQARLGELAGSAAAATPGAKRSRLLRWLLIVGAVFLLWRVGRGAKKAFWTLLGIGMALYWSGAGRVLSG